MARTDVTATMRADNRRLAGDLGKSRSMFKRSFRKIGRGIKSGLGRVFSPLGAGIAALGIGTVARDVVRFEETLQRLTDQAGVTSPAAIDKTRQAMISLSKETGIGRQQIALAQKELVDLIGPTGLSADRLNLLAEANLATGASMKDLAGLSFVLEKSLDIDSAEKMKLALSAIATAGQFGSISMGEMVPVMKKVASSFKTLSGGGVGGAAELAAALQLLIGEGFATAEEAGTGLSGILAVLAKKGKELGKFGINVTAIKDGKEQFVGLREVLTQISKSKLGKSEPLLRRVFGRKEPAKAVLALIKNFKRLEVDQARAANQNARRNSIDERAGNRRRSRVFKLKKSLNDVRESIAKSFTPERIEQFAALMEKVAQAVGFIADNMLLTAGVFGAIKVGGFLLAMRGAAVAAAATAAASGATAAATAASATAAARFSLAMKAAGIAAAAIAGFALGKFIDEKLDLSGKIAEKVSSELRSPGTENVDQGFLRDRLERLTEEANRRAFTGKGALTPEQILGQARSAVISGKTTAPTGFVETRSKTSTEVIGGRKETFGPDLEATNALKNAAQILKDAAEVQARGIKVTFGVDESGALVVKGVKREAADARRSTE